MEKKELTNQDIESLSEGWWTAVLAEDECFSGDSRGDQTGGKSSTPDGEKVENDWDFVQDLLTNEIVISGTVMDYNRGGLLICNEKFQGFVPISPLG